LIVIVFDPLAIALIIAFNGLIGKKKEKIKHFPGPIALGQQAEANDYEAGMTDDELNGLDDLMEENYKNYQIYGDNGKNSTKDSIFGDIVEENPILASEKDTNVFFNTIDNPPAPNEALVEAVEQYEAKAEEKKKETDSDSTNLEEVTLTDEEKAALEPEITDEILLNLQPDYSTRGIDLDGDGSIDGYDTNGDGIIDTVTAHPNRAQAMRTLKPYYAQTNFDWTDRKNWINDQNAVNFWIKHIKPSQYPTDFKSKSY
jgi:hypothetical protein